jgi:tetratricopeptide (TPR) repeat protein/transcriptional regulator with XRE-family HTH domain
MGSGSLSEFGPLLRSRRLAAGLTQAELAERSGVSERTIRSLERAVSRPYLKTVALLAEAMGLAGDGRDELARAARPDAQIQAQSGVHAPGQAAPHQLPGAVWGFAGREEELRQLSKLLDDASGGESAVVISAIGGAPGVGKTALAVQWAHSVADRFPDGQLYANLRGYDPDQPLPAADALAGFLRALGMPGQAIPVDAQERAAMYRSAVAGRRMLMLLDNAGSVEQVRPLLPGSPTCTAVVTSRDSLIGLVARDGARRLELGLLPPADAAGLLRDLIEERAAADPAATVALATLCARLPLALRLAAELAIARPSVPLTGLVAELADQQRRLDLLGERGDPRTAIRVVFSWSYRHLDGAAARAFRLAGLHPGTDFDVYAVAALTGTSLPEATRLVPVLAGAHLIQPTGQDRYGLHDLLRDYARELTGRHDGDSGQRAALTRLFDHYLHSVVTAARVMYPGDRHRLPGVPEPLTPARSLSSPTAALAWLNAERANLVAIIAYAEAHGWPGHATRLARSLFRYLYLGGHCPESAIVHACAHRAARATGDRQGEAAALIGLGAIDLDQGSFQSGTRSVERALALYRETGDRIGEADSLSVLALVHLHQGRYQQATRNLRHVLALNRETGDQYGEAYSLAALGLIDLRQGRYQPAAAKTGQALAISREIKDRIGEADALGTLSQVDLRQGRYQQATASLQEALTVYREIGERFGEADALANLGLAELRQGRYQQATSQFRQALSVSRDISHTNGEVAAMNGLGEVLSASGLPDQASAQHSAALDVASRIDDKYEMARAHHGLGNSRRDLGDPGQARHHWQEALALCTELGAPEADQLRAKLSTQ